MLYNVVVALGFTAGVSASSCSEVDGNYYCSEVNAISYSGIGYSGSYSDVTDMDTDSCTCSKSTVSFSGSLSPLDEELSVHFRGPIKLAQFGVYYPTSSSSTKKKVKRADDDDCSTTKALRHKHKRAIATEIVEQTVYVNAAGETIAGSSTSAASVAANAATTSAASATTSAASAAASSASTSAAAASSSSSSSSSDDDDDDTTSGAWERVSYFTPGSTDNATFLNHEGGVDGSGVWTTCFGSSLSYCSSDGTSGASSAEALGDVTVDSDVEYIIFSGDECDGTDDGCGYYPDGSVAYHGFGGNTKIFVFEFTMPTDSSGTATSNQDMPAIWLLNAKIARTEQYGDCSCWGTGCGELDLFEILSEGSDKLISHIHDGQGDDGTSTGGAGDQDYFARPTDSSMKAAVIFQDDTIFIVKVDDDTDFGSSLTSDTVSDWLSTSASSASLV